MIASNLRLRFHDIQPRAPTIARAGSVRPAPARPPISRISPRLATPQDHVATIAWRASDGVQSLYHPLTG